MFVKKKFFKKYIKRNLKIDFEKIDFEKQTIKLLIFQKRCDSKFFKSFMMEAQKYIIFAMKKQLLPSRIILKK